MTSTTKFLFMLLAACSLLISSCGDPCRKVDCLNGGTCNDGDCDCPEGYEGANCGTEERQKFIGNFAMTDNCDTGVNDYTLSIEATTNVQELRVTNLYESGKSVLGTVDGNGTTFNIPAQEFGIATISGTGTLSGTNLTVQFTLTGGADDDCTATGTKQL